MMTAYSYTRLSKTNRSEHRKQTNGNETEKRKNQIKNLALEIITLALHEKKRFVGSVEETLIGKYWRA